MAAMTAMVVLATVATGAQAKTFGGVVPDVPTGTHLHRVPRARTANLPYGGGSVLHWNRTHVIFWQPAGSGLVFDPGYQALIETFLTQVAADSHKPTNVYGLSGQYSDSGGPAAYASTYAGSVVATDPLPTNGCTEPAVTGPGWTVCLTDAQLQNEIANVVSLNHLPASGNDIYFLVTPNGFGDCESIGPDNCALGGTAAGSYCGYHSSTPDGRILYAVIPYNAVKGHCQSDNPRPNSSTADPAISTISHEHNETVTDPLGDAWIDGSQNEDGDLCITNFAPALGGSGTGVWNELIHGGRYYLQEEWSNDDSSCQPRDEPDRVSFTAPRKMKPGKPAALSARAVDPDGTISSYTWFLGDGQSKRGRHLSHTFRHEGVYRVVLRTTDSSGNYAYTASTITVTNR
jgi:hypothetical protein